MILKTRFYFWLLLIFVAVLTQLLFRLFSRRQDIAVAGAFPVGAGELVTGSLLVGIVSLVYCGILFRTYCDRSNNEEQEEGGGNINPRLVVNSVDCPTPGNVHDNDKSRHDDDEERASSTQEMMPVRVDKTITTSLTNEEFNHGEIENEDGQNRQHRKRLFYLDNLKVFLTVLVVMHHVTCAFGGCENGWVLVVGIYDNSFKPFAHHFIELNQGYFMSLFFFISAYFVPSSFERKGGNAFLFDKAKRYWLPASFVTVFMGPSLVIYGQWFAGAKIEYFPLPFHCWFLYWLLLLNLAYAHIYSSISVRDEDGEEAQQIKELPGPLKRFFVFGLGICGLGMYLVVYLLQSKTFALIPLGPGSLVNDLLFFVGGTFARKHGWLERRISYQVGMPIFLLRIMVVLEATLMCYCFGRSKESEIYRIPAMLAGGIYCVDMSLVLLEFFQTHLDFENRFTKFLSDAAYTVYIVHPVFVVGVTSIWVAIYESYGNKIDWIEIYSRTPIGGLSVTVGWLASNVIAMLLLWPFSWLLRKLPGLRQIL